jgi:hypothetical protein
MGGLLADRPIRGLADPVAQAVTAEAGQAHQVDVLGVGPHSQVLDQATESGGGVAVFDLDGHGRPKSRVIPAAA